MDAKIKWSKTAKEIVLQIKFPKEILDFNPLPIDKGDDYLEKISNRMQKFFKLIFANGFLVTGNSDLKFGKNEIPTLKVEIIL